MHTARRTFVATGTVALLAAAGVTAAIAADPAPPPPPRIAFVANGIVPADALAAGPIAGQLGAPIYTTQPDTLSPAAATGLDDHDPELVIVLGGPVAIHDTVIDQVEDATGLAYTDTATPDGGIVRAAGGDRFDTAAAVADLLAAYNPAYLPIDMQAIDADTVDGKHASDFQPAGDYLAAGGTTTLTSLDWRNVGFSDLDIIQYASQVRVGSGSDAGALSLNPDMPTIANGAPILEGMELCVGSGGDRITSVELYLAETSSGTDGDRSFLIEDVFTWDQGASGCQTYAPSSTTALSPIRVVGAAIELEAGTEVQINRTTFTLRRAS